RFREMPARRSSAFLPEYPGRLFRGEKTTQRHAARGIKYPRGLRRRKGKCGTGERSPRERNQGKEARRGGNSANQPGTSLSEQGTERVFLYSFSRPTNAAPQYRRIQPGAAGGLWRQTGFNGARPPPARPPRGAAHGNVDRRYAESLPRHPV